MKRTPLTNRVILCVLILAFSGNACAKDLHQLKAAFIFNFAKFVNWPETQEATGGDFRLCISRNNPIVKYLNQLEGRPLRNFTLRVMVPSTKEALGTCHIIYIPDEYDPSHALSEIDNYPVLTVGDQSGFIEQGGAIQLVTENNRVSFDVNLQHIRTVGLDINAKVLQLARKVY